MAEILQSHAVAHQSLWQGALCSFFLFQACVGVDLLKKIYKSFYEGAGMGAITNPKIAGTAQLLNYLLHSIVATFVGGFAAEIIAFLTGLRVNDAVAFFAPMLAIWAWCKLLGDSPYLS